MGSRKKALIIVSVLIVVLTGGIIAVTLCVRSRKQKAEEQYQEVAIVMNHWNDTSRADYIICTVYGKRELSAGPLTESVWFETDMRVEDIIATNAEDYIGTRKIYMENIFMLEQPVEIHVFYSENNYYFFYWNAEWEHYTVGNLSAGWHVDGLYGADIMFPFPEPMAFFEGLSEYDDIQYIFECHDFEDMKDFYSRISEEYYSVDEENQTIKVKAYGNTNNFSWDGGYRYEIIIDCKNRTITGPARDGGTITLQ